MKTIEHEGKTYYQLDGATELQQSDIVRLSCGHVAPVAWPRETWHSREGRSFAYWRELTPEADTVLSKNKHGGTDEVGDVDVSKTELLMLGADFKVTPPNDRRSKWTQAEMFMDNSEALRDALARVAELEVKLSSSEGDVRQLMSGVELGTACLRAINDERDAEGLDPARAVVLEMSVDEAKDIREELGPQWHRGPVRALLDALEGVE